MFSENYFTSSKTIKNQSFCNFDVMVKTKQIQSDNFLQLPSEVGNERRKSYQQKTVVKNLTFK